MQTLSKLAILALVLLASISQAQTTRTAAACDSLSNESIAEGNLEDAVIDDCAATGKMWPNRIRVGFGFLRRIDTAAIREFESAWVVSGFGTSAREVVVLMFREEDGSYKGKSQAYTNEYQQATFTWDPDVVAIVHTHPNSCDPKPSEHDQRVAEKYDVPIFTITSSGMYAYDPATKVISKVLDGLDWLKPSKWTQDVYRNLIASFVAENNHRPLHHTTITEAIHKHSVDKSSFK